MPATVRTSAGIPWHRRIEAVVVVGSSLLVAVSLGAVLVATTRLVTNRSLDRASLDIETEEPSTISSPIRLPRRPRRRG
jgi:hypothetical protein